MRLEILVGNDEPRIFHLNRPKIFVGSGENCDIMVGADGVSRKHIAVLFENDSYFIVDQGSTNGSYINEERLVPGRKVEFNSFFPVRLGDNVLLTLLSDEEVDDSQMESLRTIESPSQKATASAPNSQNSDSTRAFSLHELKTAKTEALIKKRHETTVKRKKTQAVPKPKIKDKSRMMVVKFLSLAIVLGAVYYNFFVKQEEVPPQIQEVGQVIPVEKPKEEAPKEISYLLDEQDLTKYESLSNIQMDIKCTTDQEKYLCVNFPGAGNGPFGVVQVGTMLNILVDGTSYIEEARTLLKVPETTEDVADYGKKLKEAALIVYLHKSPQEIDMNVLKDFRITLALYEKDADRNFKIFTVAGLKSEIYKDIRTNITPERVDSMKKLSTDVFENLKKYWRIY